MSRRGKAPADRQPPTDGRELKRRRDEVERRLQAAGLRRASISEIPRWRDPQTQARMLRLPSELRALGPLFSRLGRYLSTRIDHLAGVDCLELAALPDRDAPIPPEEVQALLRSELGMPGAAALARLEPAPVESLALSQTHRGWLSDGRAVSVKLSRRSVLRHPDLALLPGLAELLSSLGWPVLAAHRILDDFADLVERRLDLRREAETLDSRTGSTAEALRFGTRRVVHALSTSSILTLEVPPGASPFVAPADLDPTPEATALARDLADLWMHLVFNQHRIPEELSATDLSISAVGALELCGGLFQPIAHEEADALWSYLVSAARDDPDAIFEALRTLCTKTDGSRPEVLRHQLGHVVPRRDGRFGEAAPGFPELLLSHWQHAERYGLVPNPCLLAFYRGLVSLRDLAGPALSRGVLRESLQVIQISRGTERLRKTLDPALLARGAEGLVRMLTDLPRLIERTGAFRRSSPALPEGREDDEQRDDDAGFATLAAWLLLAATFALWFQRLPTLLGGWTDLAQAGALALLGAGLLHWIWRST